MSGPLICERCKMLVPGGVNDGHDCVERLSRELVALRERVDVLTWQVAKLLSAAPGDSDTNTNNKEK